jgi:hypothetical protein
MRLTTIWSLQGMSLAERLRRTRECGAMGIARHLPLRIRYWTAMQEISRATMTSPNIPATPLDEILKNLDQPKSMS